MKYLDPRPNTRFFHWGLHNWGMKLLVGASLTGVVFWLGIMSLVNIALPARFSVLIVGIMVVGVPATVYFMRGVSYEKAVVIMLLTLPLLYGFVLELGGNFRIPYLFAVLAFGLCLMQGKLRKFPTDCAILLLFTFVIYAVFSTALTFGVDTSGPREAAGFRLSPLRSVIQAAQLILMVLTFIVTINYVTSFERLSRFSNLIFWSTAALTLYGVYDFVAALFDLHFYSIIYDLSYYAGGSDSPTFMAGGVTIPRPRATLGEPLDLSIFLLFGLSFAIASLSIEKSAVLRVVKICFIFLGCLLFLVANSRSSLLAIPVIFAVMLWLAPGLASRLKILVAVAIVYLMLAFVIFPAAGGKGDALFPVQYFQQRMGSLQYIGANLRGEPAGVPIGRGYDTPFSIFRDHPIFGVGLGNYPFVYSEFVGSPVKILGSPFSLYFRLLTELGVIGTSFFLLFVATILLRLLGVIRRSTDSRLRPFALASLVAIVGVMIGRLGLDGLYTDNYMWVMFGVGIVVPWLAQREQKCAIAESGLATN